LSKKNVSEKEEFEISLIDVSGHGGQNSSLWSGIVKCVKKAVEEDEGFFILCKDDHTFTAHYKREKFIKNLIQAYAQYADMLVGGVGRSGICIPITSNRYWIDQFLNASYIVVYKQLYPKILSYKFNKGEDPDRVLSKLSINKIVTYPFISKRHNFGANMENKHVAINQRIFEMEKAKFEAYDAMYNRFHMGIHFESRKQWK